VAGGYHCLFKPRDFLEMTSYQAQMLVTAVKEFSMKVSEERERRLFLVVGKSGNCEESARQSKKHESNVEED
jgi:hypothetical protein